MELSRLIELFLQTAKINALSGNEKPIANFIKLFLNKYNYNFIEDDSRQFSKSNTGNLICKIGDGGDFLLSSHMDTARPTDKVKPVIDYEKITSSGDTVLGVDNRVGVSVLLFLLEKIALEKIPVKNFTVVFTTCEETTLFGSKHIGLNGNIKKGFVFDSGYRPGNFIYSACGAIGYKIKIFGKAAHSGIAPEKGINSLQIAARAISRLPLGRIDEKTTMNIGLMKSGSAVNVVPESTEFEGEIRSFDLSKAEKYLKNLTDILTEETEKENAKIEINHYWDFIPYTIPESADVYKETIKVLTKVGLKPTPKISLGGSDANSFNGLGIQSVNLGIGAQNPHSNDEFIFIEDLIKTSEIALELVRKI